MQQEQGGGFDRALIAVSTVVVVGAITSILDITIVNIAIRSLAEDFEAGRPFSAGE